MSLNWNNEVVLDIITASILFLGSIIFIVNSRRNKVKPLLFFGLSWLFYSLFFYLEAISYLLLSVDLAKIQTSLVVPSVILLVMYIDYTRKESLNVFNIAITTGFSFIALYSIFLGNDIVISEIDGQYYTVWTENVLIFASIIQVLYTYFLMYWVILSATKTPMEIKYIRTLFLVGIIFLAPLGLFFFILSTEARFFIIIADVSMCIGALITIYVLVHEPKIFYILPFTAYQLNIIHKHSGLPLYVYKWTGSQIREDIISANLHGLRNLSIKIMGTGEVLDLKLERGVLLIQETENVVFGLLSTNSSKFLRESLRNFSLKFEETFEEQLSNKIHDATVFRKTEQLVKKYFANIPSRIDS